MEQQLVSYETAVRLKSLGFDLDCFIYCWDKTWREGLNTKTLHWTPLGLSNHNKLISRVSRPLYQQVQKWLREIHKIDIYIQGYGFGYYAQLNNVPPANQGNVPYIDRRWNMPPKEENSGNLRTYEQALEVGIQQALNLINNGTDTNNS